MIRTASVSGRRTSAAKPKPLSKVEKSHQAFWVNNGPILHGLKDLEDALLNMADETFAYHVNKHKNDFAKWIAEALNNSELGKKLERSKTKKAFIQALQKALQEIDK